MCIVMVSWIVIPVTKCIDGRLPLMENSKQAIFWMPKEQVDLFTKLALCDYDIISISVFENVNKTNTSA